MYTEQTTQQNCWEPVSEAFLEWVGNRHDIFEPGLVLEPSIKVLIFLALLDAGKSCTYEDLREIFRIKKVINGNIPDNTLRTSVLNLGKTLTKFQHSLELKSSRGRFQLTKRTHFQLCDELNENKSDPTVLILDPPAFKVEQLASILIKKGVLPFSALYFLEWSARWWETYSSQESEVRVKYEAHTWDKLGIKERLLKNNTSPSIISFVSLATGEGLTEIELLKKILKDSNVAQVHYLSIDSSQRLLRDHIGLLKETLTTEIEEKRLICTGIIADIFSNLNEAVSRVRTKLKQVGIIPLESEFIPKDSGLLVTYLGNCLGNNAPDQETEIFSIVHSVFQNRPLEFLVGVSVMRSVPDSYQRTWDDFLLQTPRHLLETKKLLNSHRPINTNDLPEFTLSKDINDRCPAVVPEAYIVRHQIVGQIYRFYYRLAFDLSLSLEDQNVMPLPKGSLILLYNIIKYNVETLVDGIEKCGLFKISYDKHYHHILDSANGKREYTTFSAYLE